MLNVIIAGSREFTDYSLVEKAVEYSGFFLFTIVDGCARGIDTLAIDYAKANKIPYMPYPARWKLYGRYRAGHLRNYTMALNADALIAVWDGESKGTGDMIKIAKRLGLRVFVYYPDKSSLVDFFE